MFPHCLRGWKEHLCEEAKMQSNEHISRRLLDAIGGEPLAGSGFEGEEPDAGFLTNEEVNEE
jgi:hypothetical protein